jgi:hypothetical protein
MNDEAVLRATGKDWKAWFAILDKAGAKTMPHKDIAQLVYKKYLPKNPWWSQMVTVQYEQARGLRKKNQNASGFLVAVHKTMPISPKEFLKRWQKVLASKKVAAKKLERVPSKTKRPMLRYKASVGGLVVLFEKRGDGTRAMVEAIRLPNKTAVERERAFWRKVLDEIAR